MTAGKAFQFAFVALLMFVLYMLLAIFWFSVTQLIWKDELLGGMIAYMTVVTPLCIWGAWKAFNSLWQKEEDDDES